MATKIVTKNSSTASAVPTASDLVQGELAVNVADKRLFTEDNGGAIVELGTNPSALTVTGEITANGGIALGDNDKATFGAGDDLEIYHNGSNSIITETGTGNLYLGGDNLLLTNGSLSAAYLEAITGGAVNIYHNGSTKLATTSTGIDVTGTATMGGLTVNTGSYGAVGAGSGRMYGSSTHGLVIQGSGTTNDFLFLGSDGSDSFKIANNGDISFYEDTGTTPKLFWDASAESLGIGNTVASSMNAGANQLVVGSGSTGQGITLYSSTSTAGSIHFADGTSGSEAYRGQLVYNHNGDYMAMYTAATERLRIDSSGNVGIGTTNPDTSLHVTTPSGTKTELNLAQTAVTNYRLSIPASTDALTFVYGANIERMRIDSSGNVGIGTSSPSDKLHVGASSGGTQLKIQSGSGVNNCVLHTNGTTDSWRTGMNLALTNGSYEFYDDVNNVDRMVIDASGNVLVGKTAAGFANTGHELRGGGSYAAFTRDGGTPVLVNRKSSDGTLVEYMKDGTTVGSIGSNSGYMVIGSPVGTDAHLLIGNGLIHPATSTGGSKDNAIDIGGSSNRFKDLYLSGTGYFGTSVGIGTSSPDTLVHAYKASNAILKVAEANGYASLQQSGANSYLNNVASGGSLIFRNGTAPTERARIDSSGNLTVGDSSTAGSSNSACTIAAGGAITTSRAATNNQTHHSFVNPNGVVGTIKTIASQTSFNTSSDQRLKENIADADDAGSKVDAIQVRQYDWKADGSHQDYGMIAQELLEVAPEAVSQGETEEEMMGVDYSKLVPMLIKEIQSLRNRVAQLEE
jgi:hypothetical protein